MIIMYSAVAVKWKKEKSELFRKTAIIQIPKQFSQDSAMKISAKAEYACVAMVELAAQYSKGQPVSIKAIAETYGISPGFLIQILLQLKGAGLVASSRGAAGGYQLAQAPDAINLANIIDVI